MQDVKDSCGRDSFCMSSAARCRVPRGQVRNRACCITPPTPSDTMVSRTRMRLHKPERSSRHRFSWPLLENPDINQGCLSFWGIL